MCPRKEDAGKQRRTGWSNQVLNQTDRARCRGNVDERQTQRKGQRAEGNSVSTKELGNFLLGVWRPVSNVSVRQTLVLLPFRVIVRVLPKKGKVKTCSRSAQRGKAKTCSSSRILVSTLIKCVGGIRDSTSA